MAVCQGRSAARRLPSHFADVIIEVVESRTLLSATGNVTVLPNIERAAIVSPAALQTTPEGYTPAQIRKAYGFDQISLGGGVTADGSGQTIAIVDAYNDPNIVADLALFNQTFGLPAADLTIVNQDGGSKLPKTDAGWAGEIALDVEWAHAIAPGAKILLVEADSANTDDLMAAVDTARHADGVSTVSMSWGGSEFVSFGGGESSSQLAFDPFFTTPQGHTGVTFLAAAGDSGTSNGVQWPSSSPNVVAVGGTSLNFADSSGTYGSEGPWRGFRNGTSGGFSEVEIEPEYQTEAQQSGARSTPDVGYDADPNTGFAVYDSLAFEGVSGWQEIGGTSAGSPQWAALIAIANQGRALQGLGTLDGPTQTLPALYSVYGAPGTEDYSGSYADHYNDIGNDGYGYTTGLGTPHAAAVVATLIGSSGAASSPITATFSEAPPTTAVAGESGKLRLTLTNSGGARFTGAVTVTVYASTDGAFSSEDVAVGTARISGVKLNPGSTREIKVRYAIPTDLVGSFTLITAVEPAIGTYSAARTVTPSAIVVAAQAVDLSTAFKDNAAIRVRPGRGGSATLIVTNLGNVTANGTISVNLYASASGSIDGNSVLLKTVTAKKIKLKVGGTLKLKLRFTAPLDLTAGTYSLLAQMTSVTAPPDSNTTNDQAIVETTA
jgi:subtilase family serine protease